MLKCDLFRKKAMDDLASRIGEVVYVNYVEKGMPSLAIGEMGHVSQFDFIMVQATEIIENNLRAINSAFPARIPFIGEGIAIQKINIRVEKFSKVIYDNFFIKDNYELTDPARVSELRDIIFGNPKSG